MVRRKKKSFRPYRGTIVLPEGITTIDKYVFAGCHNIDRIIIPETVQNIGIRAFSKCTQLQELVIPDNVTRIGRSAFDGVKNVSYHGKLIYTPDDVYWGADSLNQKGIQKGKPLRRNRRYCVVRQ